MFFRSLSGLSDSPMTVPSRAITVTRSPVSFERSWLSRLMSDGVVVSRFEFRFEHVARDVGVATQIGLDLKHQIGRQGQTNGHVHHQQQIAQQDRQPEEPF